MNVLHESMCSGVRDGLKLRISLEASSSCHFHCPGIGVICEIKVCKEFAIGILHDFI